ncbi:MAG: peptidylprolyl isomerase [Nitrospinaceae bacterium]|jgi:peptidyl-prolyl cis-trans isomerase C|nr:peptidylprolyl isomerase [Nitrospinaceae bacterium]MDP6711644.1 peptidylprolyl isomerase [Nitrospinaceae bacterium]HAK37877.1 peptidylprolyl isomerase [Nitrospina sp.]|tara:strand:+ start:5046 stop:5633 length:588 start_codon:yes stop_codon:yes gene_type:complete
MADKERKVKKVQARHILVGTKELAEEIKKKIDDGEEFSKLAEEYSECPSKKRGGDLGWFGKGAMVRPFEVAAFTAEEGDIVGPVKTEFGWHIIYVYEVQDDIDPDAGPPTGDEDADENTLRMVAENYAHEFMMLGYSSKKVLSLFTSTHFKSANAVYNILGLDETNKIIAKVFGQEVAEVEKGGAEATTQENKEG